MSETNSELCSPTVSLPSDVTDGSLSLPDSCEERAESESGLAPAQPDTSMSLESDSDVELPDPVFDFDTENISPVASAVPAPEQVATHGPQDFNLFALELFSPPRVLPHVRSVGGPCRMSLDILTGWNLQHKEVQDIVFGMLEAGKPRMVFLSPPCTIFSCLQKCFRNYEKMDPKVLEERWREGCDHMNLSVTVAERQDHNDDFFMLEHPQRASSWELESTQKLRAKQRVGSVDFDQCMLGLRAPNGKLMKKRTRIVSNNAWLLSKLSHSQCDRQHEHQPIEGSMKGRSLSWWAQHYPDGLVKILAESVSH